MSELIAQQSAIPLENRTFFYIPPANYPRFEAQIEKLSKRSIRNGGYKIEPLVFGTVENAETGARHYEVFLDAPEIVIDEWSFVARIDHSNETGNIVRTLPNTGADLPERFRTTEPNCDHCQINRKRRDTFVLRSKDTGEFKQVGSSCMKDLFTTDPRMVSKLAETLSYAVEAANAAETSDEIMEITQKGMRDLRHIDLEEYLAHCAAVIRTEGAFRNASHYDCSTKWMGLNHYFRSEEVLPEDRDTVVEALTWVEMLAERRDNGDDLNSYEHNVLVIGEATMIEGRSCGIAASIVGCYKRALQSNVPKAPEPTMVLENMDGILGLFNRASSKIRYPKITISFEGVGDIVLSRAGDASQFPGSINVKSTGSFENATWYGRIKTNGEWDANRRIGTADALRAALVAFSADPAGVASAHGHRSGNCCFCHRKLTDARSAHVGYGKTCSENYDLPYPTVSEVKESANV